MFLKAQPLGADVNWLMLKAASVSMNSGCTMMPMGKSVDEARTPYNCRERHDTLMLCASPPSRSGWGDQGSLD